MACLLLLLRNPEIVDIVRPEGHFMEKKIERIERMSSRQRTIEKSVHCCGIGLHSGKKVNLVIRPAPVNHGIKFVRTDLPHKPIISAHFRNVIDTSLATTLETDGVIVSTIEHLMASFTGLGIDNVLVEIVER